MRKTLVLAILATFATTLFAQSLREEIRNNLRCSASHNMAYRGPRQLNLKPAPEGKHPFYISHYGRYGSRYLSRQEDYDAPYYILTAADSAGKLTPLGRDVLQRLSIIRSDAINHWGELTELGARQHRHIIKRMVERFPEVFAQGSTVDARSNSDIPCILSMENALIKLTSLKPQVTVHHNATQRDMYYLASDNRRHPAEAMDSTVQAAYRTFKQHHTHYERLMQSLFNDTAYVRQHIDADKFNSALFRIASNVQNTTVSEQLTLYDLYDDDEIYDNWKCENARWYATCGAYTRNDGKQLYSQHNLLRTIIAHADSCLQLKQPSVQLRYGNETVIIPLLCLLDVNGYGMATGHLETVDKKGWADFKLSPMAANIQLVFYRSSPKDNDVLFKVLVNENEARLPLRTDVAPYYHWRDFREYYLKKLDAYEKL